MLGLEILASWFVLALLPVCSTLRPMQPHLMPGQLSESKLHIASLVRQCLVHVLQCESICVKRWTLQLVHLGLNPDSPHATYVTFNLAINFSVIQHPHS